MTTAGKRKPANQFLFDQIDENQPELLIKVKAYTPMAKPLNGPVQKGSYMVLLQEALLAYTTKTQAGKETNKRKILKVKLIKPGSIKGIIRHATMKVSKKRTMEVCHSTDKLTDKDGKNILPDGFHPLGWCSPLIRQQLLRRTQTKAKKAELDAFMKTFANLEERCVLHEIFGGMHFESRFSVYVKPILKAKDLPTKEGKKEREKLLERFQLVHYAQEDRNVMSYEGKPLQNFVEEYFSGDFEFIVNVTDLEPYQLGLILNALRIMKKLGRGYNAGYGHLFIESFECVKRFTVCQENWNGHEIDFDYKIRDEPEPNRMQEALKAWQRYCDDFEKRQRKHNK